MTHNVTITTRRAFTIWELICVIFVILLLISLLMPSLSKVRTLSSRVVCDSYLNIYGRTGIYYLNENDDTFPKPDEWLYTATSDSDAHPIGCRWHDEQMSQSSEIMNRNPGFRGKMWDYFADMKLRPCPIFRDFAESKNCENPKHNRNINIEPQYNYSINAYLGSEGPGGVKKLSEVRDPSAVFFFAEENCWSIKPERNILRNRWLIAPLSTKALDDTVLTISPTPESINCFATFHSAPNKDINRGSGNVVFLDGHVGSITAEDQLRKVMHAGNSRLGPGGNLTWAWAAKVLPPGGWEAQ